MIIIRADGNSQLGTGHIMRCLSIAEAACEMNIDCLFVTADDSMRGVIAKKRFENKVLDSDYTNMESELQSFTEIIDDLKPDIVLIDSYYVTKKYLEVIKRHCKTAYIDDMLSFAYPVDILINYNVYADSEEYKKLYKKGNVPLPETLFGTKYAPLRSEFRNVTRKPISENVTDILISAGGADPENVALRLISYLIDNKVLPGIRFHFVIGSMNKNADMLVSLSQEADNIVIHQNLKKMSELMCGCDIAVSAAGTTLYELCACGIPTITYVLADNQIKMSKCFFEKGIMLSAGDVRSNSKFEKNIIYLLCNMINDKELRYTLSMLMSRLVDGRGVSRLIEAFN